MRFPRHAWLRIPFALLALLALPMLPTKAQAQTYPDKPVRILVPYTAGGPADVLVRALGDKLSASWGQPVIVDNRPGANEMIAAEVVAKSPGDGYTLLVASDAVFSLNQHLYSKIPYDPVKDFVPVTRLVTANLMLVARQDFPANTLKDAIEYIRKNPNEINYGSVGTGGVNHLAMAWLASTNKLEMQHVPYKGLPPALQDLVTGRIDIMFAVIGGAAPFLDTGKLKALAVAGEHRWPLEPKVPTFAEAGSASFEAASFYFALAAPRGTSPAIADKVAKDAAVVVHSEDFKSRLKILGFEPASDTPAQFAAFLQKDRVLGAQKVKASGARLD
ncbi:MAG TPA: tripartite tricarboxylate transporter substrate binding protein [Burkholderiales bacterium]|jgi:tripartite-type tricarboxylate transporter receptor subunit TctC